MNIAGMTLYQIFWFFLVYSFTGWVIEVIYHAVTRGQVINRGFLNGPVCPVYGFGMLAVLAVSHQAEAAGVITLSAEEMNVHSLLLLFLGSLLFATLVELIAGWLLDVNYHMRWWDYSREPFNFHGYICLKFSIIWGLSITAVILLVHPMMKDRPSFGIPERFGWPVLAAGYVLMLTDFCVTAAAVRGLNRQLEELDNIRKNMRVVSDLLSKNIGESTIRTAQKIGEGQVQAALAKAELRTAVEEARTVRASEIAKRKAKWEIRRAKAIKEKEKWENEKREELLQKRQELEARREFLLRQLRSGKLFSPGRILRGVPNLRHSRHTELLEVLKQRLEERK